MEKALLILDSAVKTLESEIRIWTKQGDFDVVEKCKLELQHVKKAMDVLSNQKKMSWSDVRERYLEFHKIDEFTENMAIDVDFGYWLVNECKTDDVNKAIIDYEKKACMSCEKEVDFSSGIFTCHECSE